MDEARDRVAAGEGEEDLFEGTFFDAVGPPRSPFALPAADAQPLEPLFRQPVSGAAAPPPRGPAAAAAPAAAPSRKESLRVAERARRARERELFDELRRLTGRAGKGRSAVLRNAVEMLRVFRESLREKIEENERLARELEAYRLAERAPAGGEFEARRAAGEEVARTLLPLGSPSYRLSEGFLAAAGYPEARDVFAAAFYSSTTSSLLCTMDLRVVAMNTAFQRTSGYGEEDLRAGVSLLSLVENEQDPVTSLDLLGRLASGQYTAVFFPRAKARYKSGAIGNLSALIRVVRDNDNGARFVLVSDFTTEAVPGADANYLVVTP